MNGSVVEVESRMNSGWTILLVPMLVMAGCVSSPRDETDLDQPLPYHETPDTPRPEAPAEETTAPEPAQTPNIPRPTVIALIDTGINPYHEEFRWNGTDQELQDVLAASGYPLLPSLDLTLDAESYDSAVQQDAAQWELVEPRTFYRIPGTRIIATGSFGDTEAELGADRTLIRDIQGHGTMTSSRASGASLSIGGDHVVIVMVDVDPGINHLDQFRDALLWVADQPWIDISVNAWGFPAPTGPAAEAYVAVQEAVEKVVSRKPTLFSAGNGVQGLAVGFPSDLKPQCIPDVICVGGEDNGRISYWLNFDGHVVADAFRAPGAVHTSLNETGKVAGGTSGAVAFAGGGLAELMFQARQLLQTEAAWDPELGLAGTPVPGNPWLDDGRLDPVELQRLFFHSARHPEENPSDGDHDPTAPTYPASLPPAVRWPLAGYGEINAASIRDATRALEGAEALPDRSEDDRYYALDQQRRRALYG